MAPTRRAQHFEMEEGRKYFYGVRTKTNYRKAFPLLLAAARQGYVHAQYLVGYAYRDALGTKKISLNRGSGGRRQRNEATREQCSILRWIMTSLEESDAIRERRSICIGGQLS